MNDIVDMSQFVEAKSDQLNADDLLGSPRTITVRKVTGESGDQPVSIYYEGDNNKPFKPCKTIRRILLGVWGKYASDYVGRSMTIYRDDSVTFGALAVGGIRISHMSHIDKPVTVVLMKTKGKKVGIEIKPLADAPRDSAKPDAATTWANGYASKVTSAPDADALESFVTEKATKLAELETKRPELHAQCVAAVNDRRADFSSFASDDMGEPEAWRPAITDLTARIEIADAGTLTDLRKEFLRLKDGLPDDVITDVEARIADRGRALERGEGK